MIKMKAVLIILVSVVTLPYCTTRHLTKAQFFEPDYWKDQGLTDVLPHWSQKATDSTNGMFYPNLDRYWKPFGSTEQSTAMLARHLFGYTAGYLMNGDEALIRRAAEIKNYLIAYGWDKQHSGWYDALTRNGQPAKNTKTTFGQVYIITGLTLYYFATKDPDVRTYIETSNNLLNTKVWDSTTGGYYDVMNGDWTVQANTKSVSSEITPVSGYLFYLYLATRNEKYLKQIQTILDVVLKRMTDPATGWILEQYNNQWQYQAPAPTVNEVNIGHNIETAWMLLRAYLLNGNATYRNAAYQLDSLVHRYGFDKKTGVWYANVSRDSSQNYRPLSYWWIQAYGNMFNLCLYRTHSEKARLENFKQGAAFWDQYFLDRQYGDTYQGVSLTGEPVDPVKANAFKASYHNMENALLNWLYLGLWVKKEALTLHFKITTSKPGDRLYPLPVEEEKYVIDNVWIDGKRYESNTRHHLFVTLPALQEAQVTVTIKPAH